MKCSYCSNTIASLLIYRVHSWYQNYLETTKIVSIIENLEKNSFVYINRILFRNKSGETFFLFHCFIYSSTDHAMNELRKFCNKRLCNVKHNTCHDFLILIKIFYRDICLLSGALFYCTRFYKAFYRYDAEQDW